MTNSDVRAAFSAEVIVEAYWQMHDTAKDLGYPSILEALEALPANPSPPSMDREAVARIIEPSAWRAYDATMRPFAENRGPREGENYWHVAAYQAGCRSVADAREWWLETAADSAPVQVYLLRESLTKAAQILALAGTGGGVPEGAGDAWEADGVLAFVHSGAEEMLGHKFSGAEATISFGLACYRAGQANSAMLAASPTPTSPDESCSQEASKIVNYLEPGILVLSTMLDRADLYGGAKKAREMLKAIDDWRALGRQLPQCATSPDESRNAEGLVAALTPFAVFADPWRRAPPSMQITVGSNMARKQLTMADCYAAADALRTHRGGEK